MNSLQYIIVIVLIILSVPYIAMLMAPQEVHWTFFDFFIAGVLLLLTGIAMNSIVMYTRNRTKRLVLITAILLLLLIIWAELAVGIFH